MKNTLLTIALMLITFYVNAQNSFPSTGSATLSGDNIGLKIHNTSENQWSGSAISFYNTQTSQGSTIWFKHEKVSQGPLTGGSNFLWRYSEPGVGFINMMLFRESNKNLYFNFSKTHTGDYGNVIVNNGNFLINTEVSRAKLTVNGDLYLAPTEAIGGWSYTHLRYAGHSLVIGSPTNTHAHNILEQKPGGKDGTVSHSDFRMWQANGADESQKSRIVQISTNPATHTYFNGGNVGIGTTSPDAKLTVKGTIHAQEVKVDLNGAVAPDYVFEPDYPLNSLHELAAYIKENKHLPEVPSAKEMEVDGVNLLEMNLILLKKVEELTLYMLKLNEGQSQLELENRKLNSEIESLKKEIAKSNK